MEKKSCTKDLACLYISMLAGASLALDICDVVIPSNNNVILKVAKKGVAGFIGAMAGGKAFGQMQDIYSIFTKNKEEEDNG